MNKIANINLETTADYQSLSGLNVQFWNQDKGTAVLQFNITRNNYPLGLSEENVKVFIALESGDSFLVDDNLDYLDELNGVVSYTIPDDFMRVASKVTGQVYVTTLDEEEVVVQRQFTFNVANDLIADLPAEDKIREIKYFSDMRVEVAQMMEKLNNDFANMNDYVTQVEQTTQDGITALTNLINTKQDAYNANHTAKLKELNDKGTEYSTKFDEDKQYIDEKSQAFKDAVAGSGLVTEASTANWQKYKMVKDDGTRTYLPKGSFADVNALEPGYYETITSDTPTQNFPEGVSNASFVEIDVTKSGSSRKQIKVVQSFNSKTFVKYIHTDGLDNGWKQVAIVDDLTNLETVTESQSKANVAESNSKSYTDELLALQNALLFEGTVNGVGKTVNLLGNLYDYNMIVISGEAPGGVFNEVVLPATIKTNIPIQRLNLKDTDGEFLGVYEIKLEVTNGTTLTIANDVSWDVAFSSGSGPGRNAFTISRVEGFNSSKIGKGLTPLGSDIYSTMTQLMSLTDEGTDWQIETNNVDNSNTIVTAIHGGGIEPGTTELAKLTSEIANQTYYSFMGLRPSNNSELHVTSTRFDEPTLLGMLNVPYTVSIHGASGSSKIIYLGGADTDNMAIMKDKLTQAGFTVQAPTAGIEGGNDNNIVNRNTRNKGIQLELTTALRKSLFVDNDFSRTNREDRSKWSSDMTKLATAISDAIKAFK